jgi:hypothetical protein
MNSIKDRTCIVGIGWTRYGSMKKPLPESQYTLACQAILAAIEDAGLKPEDIDGMMRFSFDSNDPVRISDALGLNLKFFGKSMYGGGGGCACIAQAGVSGLSVLERPMAESERQGTGVELYRCERTHKPCRYGSGAV